MTSAGQTDVNLSKASYVKKGCYACQWLANVDKHTYEKNDKKYTIMV